MRWPGVVPEPLSGKAPQPCMAAPWDEIMSTNSSIRRPCATERIARGYADIPHLHPGARKLGGLVPLTRATQSRPAPAGWGSVSDKSLFQDPADEYRPKQPATPTTRKMSDIVLPCTAATASWNDRTTANAAVATKNAMEKRMASPTNGNLHLIPRAQAEATAKGARRP